ncbi:MAG: hypothetical protein HC916_15640 [Coleofasciculaceae cyanobacterium SM2_1_6]|nr:hypothetical protein [Coleofasciculaceae cyanobacterium SM2_1_6]
MNIASGKAPKPEPQKISETILPAVSNYTAPSRQGKKAITAHVDPAVAKQIKQLALDHDTTVQHLFEEALNDLFVKYGKPPLA